MRIADDDRHRLLALARQALAARVHGVRITEPPSGGVFDLERGAFVSLHRHGQLRGCLGRIEPEPLGQSIVHLGTVVADSDPRFDPVRPGELDDIDVEISVLTPARLVQSIEEIEVGRHGVIVEQGYRRGLLLPQVPIEHQWDRHAFLEHTCLKAGLPRDAWRAGATLWLFEAEVFGEAT